MKKFLLDNVTMVVMGTILIVIGLFIEYKFFGNDQSLAAMQEKTLIFEMDSERGPGGTDTDIKTRSSTLPSPSDTPLEITIQYVYRRKNGTKFHPLTDAQVLYSGDYYKIMFTLTEKSYVYVFQTDSSDNIYRLFPMKSFKGVTLDNFNPVQPNITYYLPAKDRSFFLDNQIGEEKIYFLVARQPDVMLEKQYQQILGARGEQNPTKIQIDQTTLESMILSRGPGGTDRDIAETRSFTWEENGKPFSMLRQRLKMCEGCVNILTFQHQ